MTSVAFSPDGNILASASTDDTIIIKDVKTGQRRGQPLVGQKGHVFSVAFSPDGKTLASGSNEDTIHLWDVDSYSWQARAGRIVNRNLTCREWAHNMGSEPYRATFPNLPTDKCSQ